MDDLSTLSRDDLLDRLAVAEQTLRAIRSGEVDGILVHQPDKPAQVYTLTSADRPYRLMIEQMQEGAATLTRDGTVLYANRRFGEMIGRSPAELPGQPIERLVDPALGEQLRALVGRSESEQAMRIEAAVSRNGNPPLPVRVSITQLADGEDATFCLILTDLTSELHRNELEQRVRQRTAHSESQADLLRRMAAELSRTEQRERRHLAQQLHDGLQQHLVALKMRAERLEQTQADPAEMAQHIREIRQVIKETIQMTRSVSFQLYPPVLYDGGLVQAVRWLSRQMKTNHDVQVMVDCDDDIDVSENLRTFLFQAVRELLLNVVKHAHVDRAVVCLRQEDEHWIVIEVVDQGEGFEPCTLDEMHDARGFGVFNIEQRIAVLGGAMEIDSSPGRGCRVQMRVPLEVDEPVSDAAGLEDAEEHPATESDPHKVRVLLVDDHAMVRQGFALLFEDTPGIELVGQACDGVEAVAMARQLHPDVVTMDISMPRMDGIQATRIIKGERPEVRIIGLSMHDRADMTDAMISAGAEQYLPKDGPFESLRAAIMPQR